MPPSVARSWTISGISLGFAAASSSGTLVVDTSRASGTQVSAIETRLTRQSWFWLLLLGLGMLFGSMIALGITKTAVVLLCAGLAFLLPALWTNTYRACWFWVTTTIAGLAGYIPALLVHYHVGYTDEWHLIPAYVGLNYFLVQQALSWPYQWGSVANTNSRAVQ